MINSINKARNIDYSYSKESYALQTDMTEKVDQKYIDDYIERAKKVVTAIDEYTKTLNRAIDAINTLRAFMLQNSKERTIAMNLKDGFMAYPIFNTACTVVIALAAAYISFFNI